MLEQRIQQQFFDSADLKYAAAEVLSKPIADAVQRAGRLHHRRRQGPRLRQRRLGRRCPAFRGRVRRPLRARAPRPGGDRADRRHLDPHRGRQRLRLRGRLLQAGRGARLARRRAAGDVHERQFRQRARRGRGGARPGDDRRGADRQHRRADARAADRDRRPHLRAARADRAHPGSAICWCCTACAMRSTCNCSANRKTHDRFRRGIRRGLTLVVAGAALAGALLLAGCARDHRRRAPSSAARWSRPTAAPRRAQVDDESDRGQGEQPSSTRPSATASRVEHHQLQPHGAADRRGAERGRQDDGRAGRRARRQRQLGRQRADRRPAQHLQRALQGHLRHHQGEGQPGRRQGPVRELDQGRRPIAASST